MKTLVRCLLLAGLAVPVPATAGTPDLAAYLRARAADAAGDSAAAAAGYARVLDAAPDDAAVAVRAYREALTIGDARLADRAAAILAAAGVAPDDAALFPLARAARANDPTALDAAIATLSTGTLSLLTPSLKGWAAFARGTDPAAVLATATDPVARRLSAETAALIAIATGADGRAALLDFTASQAPIEVRATAAELLVAAGHSDGARAMLPGRDTAMVALLAGQGAKPTLAFGVSHLLTRIAGDLGGEGPRPLAVALTRAALLADPRNDRARLLLADALSHDDATDPALAVLDEVPADSAFAETAAQTRIGILDDGGRRDEALALADRRSRMATATSRDWQVQADLLVAANRPAEAAPLFARVIDAGPPVPWAAWLQYGGALDRAGRWSAAESALARAVALAPREPLALNYLGYARIEHGVDVAAATRLLETAHALAPDDASIADSLGWAYLRTGDLVRALPLLEGAAKASPDNAEIAEHLGDAYWRGGRRYEARYAWAAAALTAPAADQPRIAARIANGL